jgi:outer membrane protein TolC
MRIGSPIVSISKKTLFIAAIVLSPMSVLCDPLTLEEAKSLALKNASRIKAKKHEIEKANELYRSSLSNFFPKIQTTFDYQVWDEAITFKIDVPPEFQQYFPSGVGGGVVRPRYMYQFGLSVVEPITNLYQVYLSTRLQRLGGDIAKVSLKIQERETILAVTQAFLEALRLQKRLSSLELFIETAHKHLEKAQNLEAQGLLKRDDVTRVQVEIASLEQNKTLALAGLEIAMFSLRLLTGVESLSVNDLVEVSKDCPKIDISLEEAIQKAIQNREEAIQARLSLELARAKRFLKVFDFVPQSSAVWNYSRTTPTEFTKDSQWFFAINVSFPIFEWGRSFFEYRASKAEESMARAVVAEVEDMVKLEVQQSYLQAKALLENVRKAEVMVKYAKESLETLESRFAQGVATTLDLLNARASLLDAEAMLVDATYGYLLELERFWARVGEVRR